MEMLRTLLEQQPLLTLFVVIALGYLAGEISIRRSSLGVGAVLFVALAFGWFAPRSVPAPAIGTLGLSLFLYAVGIQFGRQFIAGLTSAAGLRANGIALVGVLVSGGLSLLLIRMAGLSTGYGLGLFAGAGTSTPTLQAALATIGNDDPAVGYSVAYPLGVAGPIVLLQLALVMLKPRMAAPPASGLELLEIGLTRHQFFGKRLADLTTSLPAQVQIVALRRGDRNEPASPDIILNENDVLLATGPSKDLLARARSVLGRDAGEQLTHDRRDLDYLRVFVSTPVVVGLPLDDIALPGAHAAVVAHVRRGDTELHVQPDLVLEFGDRVGLLAHRGDFDALRRHFGDSIKGTAEFSYISIGIGMALGFLLGAIAIPVPGIGTVALGVSGVLLVALVLGSVRRTAGLNWTIPLSANLVLRNLGLTLFLAVVGLSSGPRFVGTVSETGMLMLGLGALTLLGLVVPILMLGAFVTRLPYDELAGVVAGACGNPAILAYANRLVPTDAPDRYYAMIFPGMTIAKILCVNIAAALL